MKKLAGISILLFHLSLLTNAFAQVPLMFNYQGTVTDAAGVAIDGNGYFKFAIVDAGGSLAYWANDGVTLNGTEPTTAVTVAVSNGHFALKIGDTSLTNMAALGQSVFNNPVLYMRVWFSYDALNFEQFSPDARIVSNAYAIKSQLADTVADDAINTATIIDNSITNVDISPSAAISATKIDRTGLDADTLDGLDASNFAFIGHNHDASYAVIAHTHSGYALVTHNHDSSYSTLVHGHNYAGSASDGGAASDVDCTACVGPGELANNTVTTLAIEDGSITASKLASGVVTVHPTAFQSSNCGYTVNFPHFYFTGGTSCAAFASVSLPHNVTVTSATCYVYDNSADHAVTRWALFEHSHTAPASASYVANVLSVTSAAFASSVAVTSPSASLTATIDNNLANYAFQINMSSTSSLDNAARILGCKVNYN